MQNNLIHGKIRLVYLFGFVLSGLLLLYCFRWQVVDATKFVRYAASREQRNVIPSLRGTIYASDGSTLAYSEPRYDVYVYARDLVFAEQKGLQTRKEFTTKVAEIIKTTPEQLNKLIDDNFDKDLAWFSIAKSISMEDGDKIVALTRNIDSGKSEDQRGKLQGYELEYTAKRLYPENKLGSQVLGLTNTSTDGETIKTQGLGGLEGMWDGYLEPQLGFETGELDAKGNAVGFAQKKTIEAKRGSSIKTSINKSVQQVIEDKLKWGVKTFGAKAGSVLVMEPTTGRILGVANYPTYDPNLRESTDPEAYGNKVVSEPYEIGSVGKVFTLSTALDLHRVTPNTVVIQGHNGCEKIHKDLAPICTANKLPQPPMPIKDAFRISDNLYFFHLSQLMSPEEFYTYLDRFGVGKATGVDLSGEDDGSLKDWNDWNIGETAAYSYGHSYQITMLQATAGIASLANYGVRMQPQIVTEIIEADGTVKPYNPIPLARTVSRETVALMDQIMHDVYVRSINSWEHEYDSIRNYNIAMKSGTALIPYRDRPGYSSDFNATYVGYDASPDRKFIMMVRLDSPDVGNLSSSNARILWLETFKNLRGVLGVRKIGEY